MSGALVRGKISLCWILAALLVAGGGFWLTLCLRRETPISCAPEQLAAARKMMACEDALREAALCAGIQIVPEDINRTGLIGPQWSPLTTTVGQLEAKRSALNPNFAALMVRWYWEAGLEPGDVVALGASGSFPGLTLAAICAANAMELEVRAIVSFGASMYGATRPELTIPRMLRLLERGELIQCRLLAVSPGGDDDRGPNGLYPESREIVERLAAQSGVEFIDTDDLAGSVARRLALYAQDVDLFVSVGGASANNGGGAYALAFAPGLTLDPPVIPTAPDRGLLFEYAARGLPVINALNVRELCRQYDLPYDPAPLPQPGEGGVYVRTAYDARVALGALAVALALLALGRRRRQDRTA